VRTESGQNGPRVQSTEGIIHVRFANFKRSTWYHEYNTQQVFSCKILRTENGLECKTSKISPGIIHVRLFQLQTVYMVPSVQSTASNFHVRFCKLKKFYILLQVNSTAGVIHVRLCQLETGYMIPPVQTTAGIIHVRLCELNPVKWYHEYNPQKVIFM